MSLRDDSKLLYFKTCSQATIEEINCGSLQRIADASEMMSKNYAHLISDRNWYERTYKEERERRKRCERSITALRGVITRMKKKATGGKDAAE